MIGPLLVNALVTVLNHSLFQKETPGLVAGIAANNLNKSTSPSSRGQLAIQYRGGSGVKQQEKLTPSRPGTSNPGPSSPSLPEGVQNKEPVC